MVYICNLFKTLSGKSISNESPSHIFIFMHKSFKFCQDFCKATFTASNYCIPWSLPAHTHSSHTQTQCLALQQTPPKQGISFKLTQLWKRKQTQWFCPVPPAFSIRCPLKISTILCNPCMLNPCGTSSLGIDAELGAVSSDRSHQHRGLRFYFIIGKDGQHFPDRNTIHFSVSKNYRDHWWCLSHREWGLQIIQQRFFFLGEQNKNQHDLLHLLTDGVWNPLFACCRHAHSNLCIDLIQKAQ